MTTIQTDAQRLQALQDESDRRHILAQKMISGGTPTPAAPSGEHPDDYERWDGLREAVSDFRKATYEFARGQRPEDNDTMMAAQRRIFAEARAAVSQAAPEQATPAWRCFHCEASFTDRAEAALHFGNSERKQPACEFDVVKLREMEALIASYAEEDTDLHRQMHALQSKHAHALRREEEVGYARGLRDARALAAPSGAPKQETPAQTGIDWEWLQETYRTFSEFKIYDKNGQRDDYAWKALAMEINNLAAASTVQSAPAKDDADPIGGFQAEDRQAKLDDFVASMQSAPVLPESPIYQVQQLEAASIWCDVSKAEFDASKSDRARRRVVNLVGTQAVANENLSLVIERLERIESYPDYSEVGTLATEALVCARALVAAQSTPVQVEGQLQQLLLEVANASFDCGLWDDEMVKLSAITYETVLERANTAKKALTDYVLTLQPSCYSAVPAEPASQHEVERMTTGDVQFLAHWDSVCDGYGFGTEFNTAFKAAESAWNAAFRFRAKGGEHAPEIVQAGALPVAAAPEQKP